MRALVLLGLANLTLNAITPPERMPNWISGALLYPISSGAADVLRAFAPQGAKLAGEITPAVGRAIASGANDNSVQDPAGPATKIAATIHLPPHPPPMQGSVPAGTCALTTRELSAWRDPDDDTPRVACGVFGVFGAPGAAQVTALGLHALQHRGPGACNIVSFDGQGFHS